MYVNTTDLRFWPIKLIMILSRNIVRQEIPGRGAGTLYPSLVDRRLERP